MSARVLALGVLLGALVLAACGLNPKVLYKCDDGGCVQPGFQCWSDGYCHPPSDGNEDGGGGGAGGGGAMGGGAGGGGGACVPEACPAPSASWQCGLFDAGCGVTRACLDTCAPGYECGTVAPNKCGLPRLCTADGVCWENPLPQGNTLNAAWRIDEQRAFFVGNNGTILHWNGERSELSPSPNLPGAHLQDVHGVSAVEAFAVGARGAVLAWDGARWNAELIGGAGYGGTLNAVQALGGGFAIAAGAGGFLLQRDPGRPANQRWLPATPFTGGQDIIGFGALGDGTTLAFTNQRTVYRLAPGATTWMTDSELLPSAGGAYSDATSSDGTVYVLQNYAPPDGGPSGVRVLAKTTATTWTQLCTVPGNHRRVRAVNGALWLSGGSSSLQVVNDAGLSEMFGAIDNQREWYAIAPLSPERAIVGGTAGAMGLTLADGGISVNARGGRNTLNKLCAFDSNGVPVVIATANGGGNYGTHLLERSEAVDGVGWNVFTVPGGNIHVLACHAESAARALAVGTANGNMPTTQFLYRTAQNTWAAGDLGAGNGNTWRTAWGPRGGPYYLAGDVPFVMRSPTGMPASFTRDVFSGVNGLKAMTGLSATEGLGVGAQNVTGILSGSGTWNVGGGPASPPWPDMVGISAARVPQNNQAYVAVGQGGAVWQSTNGSSFSELRWASLPVVDWKDVWVSPTADVWMVGYDAGAESVVVHVLADAGVENRALPTNVPLNGILGWVAGDGGVRLWVSGNGGTILSWPQ